jgi:predicted nucleotidyltransferase component of viral defense system
LSILLAQKIYAAFQRKRTHGRDFYDIVFLMSFNIDPDFDYLKRAIDVKNKVELKKYILQNSKDLDFSKLAFDFEYFLFKKDDSKRVLLFKEYIKSVL